MSIYKEASRLKLRFPLRGTVNTEDLWKIPLTELNTSYMELNKEITNADNGSLLEGSTKVSPLLKLQVEILKDVITTRQAENKAAAVKAELKARLAELERVQADAEARDLQSKTPAELSAMVAELRAQIAAAS